MKTEREPEPDAVASVEGAVAALCAEVAPAPGPPPALDASLASLGFDSLATADLAAAVEERFGVRLADADVAGLRTVRDVAAAIHGRAPIRHRVDPDLGKHQRASKVFPGPLLTWWLRLGVEGAEHLPTSGPVVLASNHRSFWDIPVHVIGTPRPVFFMAKKELYKGPVVAWLWKVLGGFPVRREIADIRSLDTALALLERGEVVILYPEGTRSPDDRMLPFLKGSAWLALSTGAPLVPCALIGTERRVRGRRRGLRRRVTMRFGPAIPVEREPDARARRARSDDLTERLLAEITALL
jgi:1-acyl-sn-glycerol-3-phosphate acyltransferase